MDENDKRLSKLERFFDDSRWLITELRRLQAGEEVMRNEQRRLNQRLNDVWDRLHTIARTGSPDLFGIIDSVVNELIDLRANAAPPLSDTDRVGRIIENVSAKVYDKQAREDIVWLTQEIARLRKLVKNVNQRLRQMVWVSPEHQDNTHELVTGAVRHIKGNRTELMNTHDILAQALGYEKAPTAEEDPNCPCPGDYVTGEHTTETLAMQMAADMAALMEKYIASQEAFVTVVNQVDELKRENELLRRLVSGNANH